MRHLVKETLGKQDLTFGWGGWAASPSTASAWASVSIRKRLARVSLKKEILFG